MSVAVKMTEEPVGKLKMADSLHQNVSFLNPGDTLLLEAKHWRAAEQIADSIRSAGFLSGQAMNGEKLVIEISGPSGAGKTEMGYCIGAFLGALGYRCVCYSTDNCYRIDPTTRSKLRSEAAQDGKLADVIGSDEYDWELIKRIENGLMQCETIPTPVVDITKAERPTILSDIDYSNYDILLLDGLYAIGGNAPVKVCIDQTWEGILHAQKVRGKETTDELRMSIIKLEMEAVKELSKQVKGTIFNLSTTGKVEAIQR